MNILHGLVYSMLFSIVSMLFSFISMKSSLLSHSIQPIFILCFRTTPVAFFEAEFDVAGWTGCLDSELAGIEEFKLVGVGLT